jgi:hypothetical protein
MQYAGVKLSSSTGILGPLVLDKSKVLVHDPKLYIPIWQRSQRSLRRALILAVPFLLVALRKGRAREDQGDPEAGQGKGDEEERDGEDQGASEVLLQRR